MSGKRMDFTIGAGDTVDEIDNTEVALWEREGGVWVCASTPDTGLPMEATLLTDVWNDTGILPPLPRQGSL